MEIPKQYSPLQVESKWYQHWLEQGCFSSKPDHRESFTIVIPPPNVTGVLHMGHMLNNTIQDVLIRRARMNGKNACWVPGTDHASIATEAKVVNKLKSEGIEKSDLTREAFLEHAWEWKTKHGGIILEQLKRLGASCDWDRTRFTMDEPLSAAVIDVFIDLYNKGLIYRGVRMVNWDPAAQTALSDEEVIYRESPSRLYHVKYLAPDGSYSITVATTRPETILGDVAVCVHPEDERYKDLVGKSVLVPLNGRVVPIISDEYVDREFGTGALKITPAHDINDYQIGVKHGLQAIDVIAKDGTMSPEAGMYIGQDRFAVRKQIVKDMDAAGLLVKVEDIVNKAGYSERTDAMIEPKLSLQWFLKMDALAKPALDVVLSGKVQLHPAKYVNTYKHWMENVKDWCISRQLWWGQRIPAWYDGTGDFVVARTAEEALKAFAEKGKTLDMQALRQDEDVLDTWFSSWLWPISVFDPEAFRKGKGMGNEDLRYYYPTKDLVTAPEILFFWVARMIMAGLEYTGEVPFSNVYLTGIVRDKQGRKMSKSLGNSPDPIELIEKYGADGVRMGMLLTSPAGNDLPFDESLCEQGRNFNNKIWNAFRLVSQWQAADVSQSESARDAVAWFENKLASESRKFNELLERYRLSEALMLLYKLVWDDFCSWYLEAVKPGAEKELDKLTLKATIGFFESLLELLHPFIPFITEEIWSYLAPRQPHELLITKQVSPLKPADERLIQSFDQAMELVAAIRNARNEKGISPKEGLTLYHKTQSNQAIGFASVIQKLAHIREIVQLSETPAQSVRLITQTGEFFLELTGHFDHAAELDKLNKELAYSRGFLESVRKKLDNEKFMQNARPEVIEFERRKEQDAIQKIQMLESQIKEAGAV